MKKYISIILALFLLTGCKAEVGGPGAVRPTGESPTPPAGASPRPTESGMTMESPARAEEAAVGLTPAPEPDWEGILAQLEPGDIRSITRDTFNDSITPESLAPLVRVAMGHPVEHRAKENGDDQIWSLSFTLRVEGDRRDGAATLYAGLEENLVGVSLPGRMLWLEDGDLYQLIRTGMDREEIINEYWYEKCRDLVDGYYDMRLEELGEAGYTSWELTEFAGIIGTSKEENRGITVFRINAAFCTDPPELAAHRIAGGAYVDSRFRAHGLDWYPVHLVVIDGQAVGLTYDDWLERYPGEDPLDHYTEEEIRDMVAGARRSG